MTSSKWALFCHSTFAGEETEAQSREQAAPDCRAGSSLPFLGVVSRSTEPLAGIMTSISTSIAFWNLLLINLYVCFLYVMLLFQNRASGKDTQHSETNAKGVGVYEAWGWCFQPTWAALFHFGPMMVGVQHGSKGIPKHHGAETPTLASVLGTHRLAPSGSDKSSETLSKRACPPVPGFPCTTVDLITTTQALGLLVPPSRMRSLSS